MSRTRFYRVWIDMAWRCNKPNYKGYGKRGIKCLWKCFEDFRDDMYKSYLAHIKEFGRKNTSIDRIDNNGHYCKKTCRWATRYIQARNTQRNRMVTFNGVTLCLTEWSRKVNIHFDTIKKRLKLGWSIERALTERPLFDGKRQFSKRY